MIIFLQVRTNPIQDKSPLHGDEFIILPEPRTAINICSTDIMNVTISQCALTVFHNLTKVNILSHFLEVQHVVSHHKILHM